MKLALIGASSYQIFGLFNMLYNIPEYKDSNADFYLVDGFYNCDKYYENLKKCGRFDNVYLIKKGDEKKISHYFDLAKELISSPYANAKRVTKDKTNDFKYDVVVCESFFPIAVFLLNNNPDAKFYIVEDGTSAYYYDLQIYLHSSYDKRSKMYHLLRKKMAPFKFDGLYCYDDKFASVIQNNKIKCIKLASPLKTDSDCWKTISKVFTNNSKEQYGAKRIVAIDTHGDMMNESEFDSFLLEFDDNTIVRPHPRKIDIKYSFSSVDRNLDCWEFLCAETITEDHVLIGQYSTAQFAPKILFGKEPWLVFTWNLTEHDSVDSDTVYNHINRIKELYNDKNKVILIENKEQLKATISSILESKQ